MKKAISLDIGGTKTLAALISSTGIQLALKEKKTDFSSGSDSVLASCYSLIEELMDDNILAIGISAAGMIDINTRKVLYCNDNFSQDWLGTCLNLGKKYHLPTVVENDVNAALLGEYWQGAARQCYSAFMITLGTGMGGAYMQQGKIMHGINFAAAEVGQTTYYDCITDTLSPMVEHYISGHGLARLANILAEKEIFPNGKAVIDAYQNGDAYAAEALRRFVKGIATHIKNIYLSFNPEKIIIGGGMIDTKELWWPLLKKQLDNFSFPITIESAQLRNAAGVFGISYQVFQQYMDI